MDQNWGHDKLGSVGAHPFFTVSTEYCIYRFQYMTDKCVANSVFPHNWQEYTVPS